jgi:hypothetical protein
VNRWGNPPHPLTALLFTVMVTVGGSAGNEPVNKETTSTVKEEVPRMTTTSPSPQRLEQAIEVFVRGLEGLEGALLTFEHLLEFVLEPEEGALKEGAPEHQN